MTRSKDDRDVSLPEKVRTDCFTDVWGDWLLVTAWDSHLPSMAVLWCLRSKPFSLYLRRSGSPIRWKLNFTSGCGQSEFILDNRWVLINSVPVSHVSQLFTVLMRLIDASASSCSTSLHPAFTTSDRIASMHLFLNQFFLCANRYAYFFWLSKKENWNYPTVYCESLFNNRCIFSSWQILIDINSPSVQKHI